MKVLCLIDTLEVGGAEQSLLEILRRFQHTKAVMCHIYPGETLKPTYTTAGIPVISLNVPGKYGFRQALRRVLAVIRQEQPDVIHTTLFRADVIGRVAGRLAGKPVLSSFINEPYHSDRWEALSMTGRFKLKGVELLDRITARWATHFMAVSQPTRDANCAALGIAPAKVTVIYRGRDATPFLTVAEPSCSQLRQQLNLPEGAPVLLNVARILQRKGQLDLLRAVPTVRATFPQVQLLIAGEGHDRPLLEQTIRALGLDNHVHLLGRRQDIPALLQLADLFVFPSHYEGHPGSLVEAMLAACPIIASDIAVHQETITDGVTGQLVSVHDHTALAQGIIAMLAQPAQAKRMSQQAQQAALERFQIDQIAAQHETLYRVVNQQFARHKSS